MSASPASKCPEQIGLVAVFMVSREKSVARQTGHASHFSNLYFTKASRFGLYIVCRERRVCGI